MCFSHISHWCFSVWKINKRHEAGKNRLVIHGKMNVYVKSDPYERDNPVLATIDKEDEVKILDFYSGHDFGGIEVELPDGRRDYIQAFRPENKYEIIKNSE